MRTHALLLLALALGAIAELVAQGTASTVERSGAWTARSTSGLTLARTWTAKVDAATAIGTWTLGDAKGKPTARGAWSAAKAEKTWTGSWRAVVEGRKVEYSGTWTAKVDLKAGDPFVDLFEHAVQQAVSGTFAAGLQSGAWSIRARESVQGVR